ncbi:protein kinase D signaling [Ciborinia camelliae]|nr:protein kinase D signaling [Ciborinia camelliae]
MEVTNPNVAVDDTNINGEFNFYQFFDNTNLDGELDLNEFSYFGYLGEAEPNLSQLQPSWFPYETLSAIDGPGQEGFAPPIHHDVVPNFQGTKRVPDQNPASSSPWSNNQYDQFDSRALVGPDENRDKEDLEFGGFNIGQRAHDQTSKSTGLVQSCSSLSGNDETVQERPQVTGNIQEPGAIPFSSGVEAEAHPDHPSPHSVSRFENKRKREGPAIPPVRARKRRKNEIEEYLKMAFDLVGPNPTNCQTSRISGKTGLSCEDIYNWFQKRADYENAPFLSESLGNDASVTRDSAYATLENSDFTTESHASKGFSTTTSSASDGWPFNQTTQTKPLLYQCTWMNCGQRFKNSHMGGRHELTHYPKQWACLVADCNSARHIPRDNKCPKCQSKFPTAEELKIHDHSICRNEPSLSKCFTRRDKLEEHLRQKHPGVQLPSDTVAGGWERQGVDDFEMACGFCPAIMTRWEERVKHIGGHYKETPGLDMSSWDSSRSSTDSKGKGKAQPRKGSREVMADESDSDVEEEEERDSTPDDKPSPKRKYPDKDGDQGPSSGSASGSGTYTSGAYFGTSSSQNSSQTCNMNREGGEKGGGSHGERGHLSQEINLICGASQRNLTPVPVNILPVNGLGSGSYGSVDEIVFESPTSNKTQSEVWICSAQKDNVLRFITARIPIARKTFNISNCRRTGNLNTVWEEVDVMRKLSHRNVVKFIGVSIREEFFSVLMHPVAASTLEVSLNHEVHSITQHEITQLLETFGSLASALMHIHQCGIIHNDIKPANILLVDGGSDRGEWIISDFGASNYNKDMFFRGSEKSEVSRAFTPLYAAPELFRGFTTRTSDIWSLGCIFLEVATLLLGFNVMDLRDYVLGRPFLKRPSYHQRLDRIKVWICFISQKVVPESPISITNLENITRMMTWDPSERPSATEICWMFNPTSLYYVEESLPSNGMLDTELVSNSLNSV